ncbi:thiamine biosynthesis protein ThiF [Vulcanibacillus modesticaldus]|uniref:Thiamine biosynthesis protein ThiF n=2 Tax=Vulcanibacillus modesticaldus TaxID=337097 RepID=A0A1D2YWH7_9BACI|nr:thiamine biosynthesis protein ThiF [Vulcanibacillus modesticaldus]
MDSNDTRYSRQHLFKPIGKAGQKKLGKSRIAIVGMGALGTAISNHMVRSGVGFVRIIDRDFVEYSNLQRQMLFDENDADQALPKAIAAKNKLNLINSTITVEAHVTDLTPKNAEDLLADLDLIIDGTDNFETRYLINDVAIKNNIPWIYGGAVASRGMTFTIIPNKTPCFRCLFPEPSAPGTSETCDTSGVIGPIIQVVAAYQATEALKILLNDYEHINTSLRNFELWHNEYSEINIKNAKNSECPACIHHNYEYLNNKKKNKRIVSLCGRESVQISPIEETPFDIRKLAEKLRHVGKIIETPYLIRFEVDRYKLTIFPDGRVLIHGTNDITIAKNLYTKYIG